MASIQDTGSLKAISKAMSIMKDDRFPREHRELIRDLLKLINDLNTSLEDLKKEHSVEAVMKNFSTQSLAIIDKQTDIVEEVQTYLSKDFSDKYFNEKSEEDRKDLENAINNYIVKNNKVIEGLTIDETVQRVTKAILGWDILDDVITGKDKNFADFEEIQIDDYRDVNIRIVISVK